MSSEIDKIFGSRVRIRACGLCWKAGSLLMVNHRGLNDSNRWWAPPGGGVEFGQTAEETLIREFKDETGLEIAIGRFVFACEFIKRPLHAIELFFEVKIVAGRPKKGFDPELTGGDQIIQEVGFMQFMEIMSLPSTERHGLFTLFTTEKSLKTASGYWKI